MQEIIITPKLILKRILENRGKISKFLGYIDREPPLLILKKIDRAMEGIDNFLDIEYEYKIFENYALAVYTVGNLVEKKIKEFSDNKEMMNSLILDKISIVALDCIKDELIKKIEVESGKFVVNEIYPATGNFSIENQKMILNSMKGIKKITINQFLQLSPIKSVAVKFELSTCKKEYDRCESCENKCEIKNK